MPSSHRRAPQCANPVQTVRPNRAPLTPRASGPRTVAVAAALTVVLVAGTACGPHRVEALAASGGPDDRAAPIDKAVQDLMAAHDLGAVIVEVTDHGRPLLTKAYGESMTGVPASVDMHFRNGAVAAQYMSTLLLRLVDQGRVALDDPVAEWFPELPRARDVTLRMLAGMTSGYPDFVSDALIEALYADPFRTFTQEELLDFAFAQPHLFRPGTNWSYAHTNYVVLGMILQQVTREPLDAALSRDVLKPLGLRDTVDPGSPEIAPPVLHAFSSERREALRIPTEQAFIEESTFWNPSWTFAEGAIQTTTISDMTRTAIGLGEGRLLSRQSYEEQIDPHLGFGHPQNGCANCRTLNEAYGFGLGAVRNGEWILQNPALAGYAGVEAYNPTTKISVAVVTTFREGSFDETGNVPNLAMNLFAAIGTIASPTSPPVVPS
jgi:CubicO group peptidase (beta-lactamase class C family)